MKRKANWKNYAGAASGGALGYIAGGRRGAIKGARLGWKSGHNNRSYATKSTHNNAKRQKVGHPRKFQRKFTGRKQSDVGSSSFKRVFRTKSKFLRGYKKVLAPQIIRSIVQTRITAAASVQAVANVNAYVGTAGAALVTLVGGADMQDCQLVLQGTEPATQNTPQANSGRTRRMLLEYCRAKYRIKNQTNMPVKITLYNCIARRDQGAAANASPPTAWTDGLLNEFMPLVGNANILSNTIPGATPFESQRFCQEWKVGKVTTIMLHPGSEHVHYVTIKPGGLLNNEYLRLYQYYKGLSQILMAVVEGGIVQDTTLPYNITTGSAEVDFLCETEYRFTAMERARSAMTQFSLLPATVTVQGTILQDTDAVSAAAMV